MIRVQFNDEIIRHTVNFTKPSKNVVKLEGKTLKENTSGFKAYRLNGKLLGDYSEFTKCTEAGTNAFLFEKETQA